MTTRFTQWTVWSGLALLALAPTVGQAQNAYKQINLVSDGSIPALHTDPNLKNPWGIALSGGSPFWISDNKTGLGTLYNTTGAIQGLVVTVPPPAGGSGPSAPTGQVFNGGSGFVVSGAGSGPARFIFSTEDGTISGWNPAANGTNAILKVDNSGSGAVYKGLGLSNNTLYATDFHNGHIDVFNSSFASLGNVNDSTVPTGYAPFNVEQLSNGKIYVTYALQDADAHDDSPGAGHGFVDVFDPTTGTFSRLASGGPLDSPWGLALAPNDFGAFSNDLLVGNFGNGMINAFDPTTGAWLGSLNNSTSNPITIDGLWGLAFGNGGNGGLKNQLYFTAGPNGEENGLFGTLVTVPEPSSVATMLLGTLSAFGLLARRRKSRR